MAKKQKKTITKDPYNVITHVVQKLGQRLELTLNMAITA